MYALHPGSLPPKDPSRKAPRLDVTEEDLVRLYKLQYGDYIVWDPTDTLEWFDFIHLYPMYYGHYTFNKDGKPGKDIPCTPTSTSSPTLRGGSSSTSQAARTSTRGATPKT